jgi:dTDP-glucose 4,6-dehydratase
MYPCSVKLLVTGGAGFIGSNFIELYSKKFPNNEIIIIDKLTYAGGLDSLEFIKGNSRITFVQGDVIDASLIDHFMKDVTHVVHFAAETHVTRSLFDSREFVMTDVLGTQNLLASIVRSRKNIIKFLHISSSEVYGTAEYSEISEEHPLNPLSPYAAAKCGADRLVFSFIKAYRIPGIIVRPFNNYGPRQHLEKVIPRFITSAMSNLPLVVHGDGSSQRDWIHVHDTCNALIFLLNSENIVLNNYSINLGTGISTSNLEIARMVLSKLPDSRSTVEFTLDRPGQVVRHTSSRTLAEKTIPKFDPIPFKLGLEKTINWYLQNQIWWEKRWDSREIPIILEDGRTIVH